MAGRIDLNVIRITQTIAKLSDRVASLKDSVKVALFGRNFAPALV